MHVRLLPRSSLIFNYKLEIIEKILLEEKAFELEGKILENPSLGEKSFNWEEDSSKIFRWGAQSY